MFAAMGVLRGLRRPSMLLVAGVAAHHYLKRWGLAGAAPPGGPPPEPDPAIEPEQVEPARPNGDRPSPAEDVNAVVEDLYSMPPSKRG
jgi:hypothetical protein